MELPRWQEEPSRRGHRFMVKRVTKPMNIKGHHVEASKDDPQYVVRSDNGGRAVHKPSALRRISKSKDTHSPSNRPTTGAPPKKPSVKKPPAKGARAAGAPTRSIEGRHSPGGGSSVSTEQQPEIWTSFRKAVNMSAGELERWLESSDSRKVGQKKGGSKESTGHASGRRIVAIRRTKKRDLSGGDYRHMRKVVGYVDRHSAQRPKGDVTSSRWRYSLMNWGHDPLR